MVTTAPAQREHLVDLAETVRLSTRSGSFAQAEIPVRAHGNEIHLPYGSIFATQRGAINLVMRNSYSDIETVVGQGWGKVEVDGKTYHYAFLVHDVTKMRVTTGWHYTKMIAAARAAAGLPALPAVEA